MRKYLVAAIAATAAIGVGTAVAEDGPHTASMKVTVAPKKAGTKKKPANSSVHLTVTNDNHSAVLTKLSIHMPKTLAVSGKGFPACKKSKLANSQRDNKDRPVACKSSRVGTGTAQAMSGVNTLSTSPVSFKVTALTGGKNTIYFFLAAQGQFAGLLPVIAPGTVKHTSKGPILNVTVPKGAQFINPLWNGLVQLDTTLKGQKGTHKLIASTGCKSKKQKFSTKLTFGRTYSPTPDPGSDTGVNPGQGPGYDLTVKASSACK